MQVALRAILDAPSARCPSEGVAARGVFKMNDGLRRVVQGAIWRAMELEGVGA